MEVTCDSRTVLESLLWWAALAGLAVGLEKVGESPAQHPLAGRPYA